MNIQIKAPSIHIIQGFASDTHIYRHSSKIIELYSQNQPDTISSNNKHFLQICGKHKTNAYWIIGINHDNSVVGICTLGSFDMYHLELYNFTIKNGPNKKEVARVLCRAIKKYARLMSVVTFEKKENTNQIELLQNQGAIIGKVVAPPDKVAVVFPASGRVTL